MFFFSDVPHGFPAYHELGPGMVGYKMAGAARSRLRMITCEGKPR